MTAIRSVVLGCGSYLPERILTNAELATRLDTSDEWIVQRTGIRERHVAAEGEFTSHLAIKAARAALHHARLDAQAIDLIVLATSTPDNTFPATAVAVQEGLGINHLRLRRELLVHREQRVPDHVAVVAHDVGRGPDRIEHLEIRVHDRADRLGLLSVGGEGEEGE